MLHLRRLLLDIWYRIRSPLFWATFLLSAGAYFAPIAKEFKYLEYQDILILHVSAVSMGVFCTFAPCIAVLPNIRRLAAFRSGLMKYELVRCGKGKRLALEAGASMITGGLALWLGPVLVQILLSAFGCPLVGDGALEFFAEEAEINACFANLWSAGRYGAYNAAKLFLFFLFGMTVNMMALAVSAFISDSFVIAFVPVILIENMTIWLGRYSRYLRNTTYLTADIFRLPYDNTIGFLLVISGIQCAVWLICFIIAKFITDRRLNHA